MASVVCAEILPHLVDGRKLSPLSALRSDATDAVSLYSPSQVSASFAGTPITAFWHIACSERGYGGGSYLRLLLSASELRPSLNYACVECELRPLLIIPGESSRCAEAIGPDLDSCAPSKNKEKCGKACMRFGVCLCSKPAQAAGSGLRPGECFVYHANLPSKTYLITAIETTDWSSLW